MFTILKDNTICVTRGDVGSISVSCTFEDSTEPFEILAGNVLRMQIMKKGNCDEVVFMKEVTVEASTTTVVITLEKEDTLFCDMINKPVDYWYEIELNPDTQPQTIMGYDLNGAKIFRIFPEGGNYVTNE